MIEVHAQYRFGSCVVSTAFPLPTLPPAGRGTTGHIDIDGAERGPSREVDWFHDWHDGDEVVLSLAREGDGYWLRIPELVDFRLQFAPSRIRVWPHAPDADPATLEHLLVDQVLPRVLAQQGELLIHASALAIQGRHVLFLGPSGWGKSTLAGLLQRRGHDVLSDDCVQLTVGPDGVGAIPTYPSLRLNADSLAAVFPDLGGSTPVAHYSDKRRVPMASQEDAGEPKRISALYLLGDPTESDGTTRFSPLRPAETCLALIRHSFRLDLSDRVASATQLERCSQVARTVPAFRLDYPRSYALHNELAHAITTQLASLHS